jgi:hypothetical protein
VTGTSTEPTSEASRTTEPLQRALGKASPDDAFLPVAELAELAESGLEAESAAFVDPSMVDAPVVPWGAGPVSEPDPVLADPDPPFAGYDEHPSDAGTFEH